MKYLFFLVLFGSAIVSYIDAHNHAERAIKLANKYFAEAVEATECARSLSNALMKKHIYGSTSICYRDPYHPACPCEKVLK